MTEGIGNDEIRSTETRLFNGDGCSLEWAWQRVDERNFVAPTPRSYFERGTLGHKMIETYLNGGNVVPVWEAYEPPAGDWLETTKCTKEGIEAEVMTTYSQWEEQYNRLEEYENVEQVNTEVMLKCTTKAGTKVSTEADAIFWFDNSGPAIVDWKLGTSKSGKAMQLYVYWYVARKSQYIPDDAAFRAWFHYPTYSKPIVHIGDYPGDDFIETYIDNAERNRRNGPYLPNPEWFSCSQCEVKDKCPLWGGDYEETRDIEVTFL